MNETIHLINDVLVPYIQKVKEENALPHNQKSSLISDAFKPQSTTKVIDTFSSFGIESLMVPKKYDAFVSTLRSNNEWLFEEV